MIVFLVSRQESSPRFHKPDLQFGRINFQYGMFL